jgi:Rrf2 family protein
MMFSKACEYAIRATIYIAQESESGRRVRLTDIARSINSPIPFTAKILQQLARRQILDSHIGPGGGFFIPTGRISLITLKDVVDVIDGDAIYKRCGLGWPVCDEHHPCPVHSKFKLVRDQLHRLLLTTSLRDLATELKARLTFLQT